MHGRLNQTFCYFECSCSLYWNRIEIQFAAGSRKQKQMHERVELRVINQRVNKKILSWSIKLLTLPNWMLLFVTANAWIEWPRNAPCAYNPRVGRYFCASDPLHVRTLTRLWQSMDRLRSRLHNSLDHRVRD